MTRQACFSTVTCESDKGKAPKEVRIAMVGGINVDVNIHPPSHNATLASVTKDLILNFLEKEMGHREERIREMVDMGCRETEDNIWAQIDKNLGVDWSQWVENG